MRIARTWHPMEQVPTRGDREAYASEEFEPPHPLAKLNMVEHTHRPGPNGGYGESGCWVTWEIPTEDPFSIPPAETRPNAKTSSAELRRRARRGGR